LTVKYTDIFIVDIVGQFYVYLLEISSTGQADSIAVGGVYLKQKPSSRKRIAKYVAAQKMNKNSHRNNKPKFT
jgi:hypothetical protein